MKKVEVKLIDFGYLEQAKLLAGQESRVVLKNSLEGTNWYYAPELLNKFLDTDDPV